MRNHTCAPAAVKPACREIGELGGRGGDSPPRDRPRTVGNVRRNAVCFHAHWAGPAETDPTLCEVRRNARRPPPQGQTPRSAMCVKTPCVFTHIGEARRRRTPHFARSAETPGGPPPGTDPAVGDVRENAACFHAHWAGPTETDPTLCEIRRNARRHPPPGTDPARSAMCVKTPRVFTHIGQARRRRTPHFARSAETPGGTPPRDRPRGRRCA